MSGVENSYLPKIPNLDSRDFLIVCITNHFLSEDFVKNFALPDEWGLDVLCQFTNDVTLIDQADALWFHGPSIFNLPEKKEGQKWIIMSMESEVNYPYMCNPDFMSKFDVVMTYRLDSDVPCIYPNWQTYGDFQGGPIAASDKTDAIAPVVYIASNPVLYRDDYVTELMQHISVDSLGMCLHNKSFKDFNADKKAWGENGFHEVAVMLSRYKFYVAFENSITTDYVTERVLMALAFGSVPIYKGAPNIEDFLPNANCFIKADEFESPRALAEYLHYLDQNDAEYDKYLSWRTRGVSKSFRDLLDLGSIEPKHRMLIKLLHGCDSSCDCGGKMRLST